MYNESYDDYIRSILGYPRMTDMMDSNCLYSQDTVNYQSTQNSELEDCYPEIYKIVYPMIEKRCRENTRPVTKELVDSMTNEIYMAIEGNDDVQININLGNSVRTGENRNIDDLPKNENKYVNENNRNVENRQVGQFRNRTLRDLIRILLIRELLRRPKFPGNRPPMRPPFPGGMPGMPGRPPMRPTFPGGNRFQVLEDNYDLYEI